MQMVNFLLTPFKWIFYLLVSIKNYCYHIGLCKKYSFDIPIISIGNIAFGGTGKTPMVIHLCEQLKAEGYNPAIISRGYKRQSSGLVVVNNGENTIAKVADAGDEPYLMSTKLGNIPVVVSKKREQAVEHVINNFKNVNVILLDDGFQYRKLHRNVDIVLLNGNECSTILREPKSSLKRADIVLTVDKKYAISEFKDGSLTPAKPTESVYAFCGIANPNSFLDFLKAEKVELRWSSIFKDHHDYSDKSMASLKNAINQSGSNSIITTEKDLVKLLPDFLKQYKVYIVTLSIIFKDNTLYNQIIKGIKNS